MTELLLVREIQTGDATLGRLYFPGASYWTVERPWDDNKHETSCIPLGKYEVIINMSNRFKKMLPLLLEVPGRSGIRIHSMNFGQESRGCIGPGLTRANGGVLNSRAAMNDLMPRLESMLLHGKVWLTVESKIA